MFVDETALNPLTQHMLVLKEVTIPDLRSYNRFLQDEVLARLKILTDMKANDQVKAIEEALHDNVCRDQ